MNATIVNSWSTSVRLARRKHGRVWSSVALSYRPCHFMFVNNAQAIITLTVCTWTYYFNTPARHYANIVYQLEQFLVLCLSTWTGMAAHCFVLLSAREEKNGSSVVSVAECEENTCLLPSIFWLVFDMLTDSFWPKWAVQIYYCRLCSYTKTSRCTIPPRVLNAYRSVEVQTNALNIKRC